MASKAFGYKLHVSNLPWTIGRKQLQEYFAQFGHITHATVIFDKSTGMSRGFGFITFSTRKSVNLVTNNSNHTLEGRILNINVMDKSE